MRRKERIHMLFYVSNRHKKATPRLIQCAGPSGPAGMLRNMTKFVECPVVLKVPALVDTLYIGCRNEFAGILSKRFTGSSQITGNFVKSTDFADSVMHMFLLSQAAPSNTTPVNTKASGFCLG